MPRTVSLARISVLAVALALLAAHAQAGPIFLTGHDPDFHSQDSVHAQHLLTAGLKFVTGDTINSGKKFLWVESFLAPTAGHRVGELGLVNGLGLTLGTQFDWVNAAGFASVNLNDYDAIAIASSFGGMLTQDELDALIARSGDIKDYINGGGGLFASAECSPTSGFCLADTLGPAPDTFGYLPVAVTSVDTTSPYTLTAAGSLMFPTLTNDDMNDPTHNSFGAVGGLTIIDTDAAGIATTLAGVVTVGDGQFNPVPEPSSLVLLGGGVFALAARSYRKRRA